MAYCQREHQMHHFNPPLRNEDPDWGPLEALGGARAFALLAARSTSVGHVRET
jgi:hypothetical protein